jgi:hypothetical protein
MEIDRSTESNTRECKAVYVERRTAVKECKAAIGKTSWSSKMLLRIEVKFGSRKREGSRERTKMRAGKDKYMMEWNDLSSTLYAIRLACGWPAQG